jgi:hypothetical protein
VLGQLLVDYDAIQILDQRFVCLSLDNAGLEKLAERFRWLEGFVWMEDRQDPHSLLRLKPLLRRLAYAVRDLSEYARSGGNLGSGRCGLIVCAC